MTHREFEGWESYNRRLISATVAGNPDWVRLPQSKRIADCDGRRLFFTGHACDCGHISPRNSNGDCTHCHVMRLGTRSYAV